MGCTWYNPLSYGSCAGQVAKSVAGDAFQSIAKSFGDAADHAVNWLWAQLASATAVHLGGAGFGIDIGIVAAITGVVAVALFAVQILQSVVRRDPGGLGRAVKGLFVAFLGGGVAIAVVNLLLDATDKLCAGVVQVATGTNMAGLGKLILGAGVISAATTNSAALVLLALVCIVAVVMVYIALVIRKVLIVVTAVFAPLAFAGSLADITVSWTRRWIETTLALVVSKLVLVLIFVIGYGMLISGVGQSGSGATQQITQVISGILVLMLAGFAPWLALKIVHFTGDHTQQLHTLGTTAVGGVTAGGRMAQKAAPYVSGAAMPAAAGAAGAAGGGSVAGAGVGGGAGAGAGAGTGVVAGGSGPLPGAAGGPGQGSGGPPGSGGSGFSGTPGPSGGSGGGGSGGGGGGGGFGGGGSGGGGSGGGGPSGPAGGGLAGGAWPSAAPSAASGVGNTVAPAGRPAPPPPWAPPAEPYPARVPSATPVPVSPAGVEPTRPQWPTRPAPHPSV